MQLSYINVPQKFINFQNTMKILCFFMEAIGGERTFHTPEAQGGTGYPQAMGASKTRAWGVLGD